MKRTPLAALSLGLLWAFLGCDGVPGAPPPVGGQSGDDGSEHEPPIAPAEPPNPCEPEETVVDPEEAGLFGSSPDDLIAGLGLGESQPLIWVPFDGVANTTFAPGPGQSQITVGIERSAGDVVEHVERPLDEGVRCPDPGLRVPVQLALASADGALAERVATTLTFTSAASAEVSVQLPATTLAGGFAFEHVGPDGEQWRFDALEVRVRLWPGGTSGSVVPALVRVDAAVLPTATATPTVVTPGVIAAPILPSHWWTVAVWPRAEVCNDGAGGEPFDAGDAVLGLSPSELVDALVAASPWTVAGDEGTRIGVDVAAPSGLVCVSTLGARQELDVRATLRAVNAPAGSALEQLEATTVLRIGGRVSLDGSRFEELSWQRRDVVHDIPRAAFQQQTGLALVAPDEYRSVWWSWHGRNTRDSVDGAGAWHARGALLVSSLDAQQASQIAAQVAAGGPGAGVSTDADGFPLLPGDTLLDAPLAP